MIVCPNCNHPNPDGAVQCEACYTPLPAMTRCTNCGAIVQTDAGFCGQCGANLKVEVAGATPVPVSEQSVPDAGLIEPLVAPEPLAVSSSELPNPLEPIEPSLSPPANVNPPAAIEANLPPAPSMAPPVPVAGETATQLQQQTAKLLHLQTSRVIDLPQSLSIIHIGKPNDRIPPDIDVSGFPDSEIVSRIHADIRVEGDAYYIEDIGSSNGTYVNNAPIPVGSRYRLRPGDRIALGKGDKMSFLFQV